MSKAKKSELDLLDEIGGTIVGGIDAVDSSESDVDPMDIDLQLETEQKSPDSKINFTPNGKKTVYITKSGAFIKFEYLTSDTLDNHKLVRRIINYFTLSTKLITGQMKYLKCCTVDKKNKRIIIPRFGLFEILNKKYGLINYTAKSQIVIGDKPGKTFKWKGKLNPNQQIIYEHIMKIYFTPERVKLGSAGVIVNLEAGQGKSFLAAYLISRINKKTAIILHSTSLIEQWAKVLQLALGEDVSIGYFYAKKKKLGDIMLMIIDSASRDTFTINKKDYTAIEFYNQFGLIVLDECHTYAHKTALTALKTAQAPYMLGLSATPDENLMGFDSAVWWNIGPVLTAALIPGYESTSEDFKATVHRMMYYGPPEYTKQLINEITDVTNVAGTVNMICQDNIRNALVIECIQRCLEMNLYTFVFSDRRDYLTTLQELLKATRKIDSEILDNDNDFTRIVGGSLAEELETAELKSKVIFTTYPYMGTGKSIVKMNGLVLATPRKSKMKQYINRIFRLGSDSSIERHIFDICDMRLKLSSQWSTRLKYYNSKNYTVESEKIQYEKYGNKIETVNILNAASGNIEEAYVEDTEVIIPKVKIDSKKISNITASLMSRLLEKD